ncbi:diguanylate cyclase [Pikeienuella sp. HZG-20]|uniref:diguanylate cyclase n=1 Tax=Paludibacillus litoralis TaxID=3133267 RepID=UPI0030EE1817
MKHFDQTNAKTVVKARTSADVIPLGERDIGALLRDDAARAMIQIAVDSLEQGVMFWNAKGQCELASERASTMLEIEPDDLNPGVRRDDFLQACVERGGVTPEQVQELVDAMALSQPITTDYQTPSGRIVLTQFRPRADTGYVVTLTDVTEMRRSAESLAADKARAEKIERRLGAELARLNSEKALIESRQQELKRLSLVAAHAKDLIVITDPTNRIVWANEAYRRHNSLDLEMDLLGRSSRDVLSGPGTDPGKLAQIDEAIRNRQSTTLDLLCYRRSGTSYWMEQEIIPVFDEKGAHTNFIIVGRDISERKLAEAAAADARKFEEAKRTEARMLAEFNEWLQSSDTLDELLTVVSSFLGKLLPGSSGAVYTYGAARDALQRACAWGEHLLVEEFEPSACWALRRGRPYFHGGNTIDIVCDHVAAGRDGSPLERQYCLPIIAHGDTVGLLSVELEASAGTDTQKLVNFCGEHISLAIANVKMRDLLREQSTRDPLTGLYNRRYFLDYAHRETRRCATQNRPAALISLDVDHFKKFNDTHGHDAGDTVLRAVAEVLQKMFREADVPCRHGGEEFLVLMPGCGRERALERAEQLRIAIEAMRPRHRSKTLSITASIGLSTIPDDGESLQDLMLAADEALYSAKGSGRNQVIAAG